MFLRSPLAVHKTIKYTLISSDSHGQSWHIGIRNPRRIRHNGSTSLRNFIESSAISVSIRPHNIEGFQCGHRNPSGRYSAIAHNWSYWKCKDYPSNNVHVFCQVCNRLYIYFFYSWQILSYRNIYSVYYFIEILTEMINCCGRYQNGNFYN